PYGWSLIGVLEAGVNPYSGMFDNGPRSLADNNVRPAGNYPWQNRNSDSSRAGQWDNSQAFLGVSNPVYGYRLTYQNFRAAAQMQVGGYGIGNGATGMYQGQLGADFGALSVDGVLSWANNAVSLSTFGGSNVACLTYANCFINVNNAYYDPNSVLKATLSNNFGAELTAKYKS